MWCVILICEHGHMLELATFGSTISQASELPPCMQLNIWLMAFNLLLPAYPLDGGRILVDLLLLCRVPVKPAAFVTVALAVCVAVLLLVWGFVRTAILTIAVSIPAYDLLA